MSKKEKKTPKYHTKGFVLYVVETDDRILITGECSRSFMHFKRWAYLNIPERAMYWDTTAKLYVINKEDAKETIDGRNIVYVLKEEFTVKSFLPWE